MNTITILPAQAEKIAEVTATTGTSVGVSQFGSVLFLQTGTDTIRINAQGEPIIDQRETLC